MDATLGEAFYKVYTSSKEILKNKQRHLYCNMLDLLRNTCKTAGKIATTRVSVNELEQYWLTDVLPLVLDKDSAIQISAIAAVELGLEQLDINCLHESPEWPQLKNVLLNTYATQLHKLRDSRNKHWHEIWCLLIRILDRDILKSASTINTFLSIVEHGFRSSDTNIRVQAFHCWRLLIQIFAQYGEIYSVKRIKLLCIPLRSSQSKSDHAAEVKLRVWWYLISCLQSRLGEFFDSVVEPFLSFCFGTPTRAGHGAAQQYESVRDLALTCLAMLCNDQAGNEFLDRLSRDANLESFNQLSSILESSLLKLHWQPIVNAIFNAVNLLVDADEAQQQQLLQQLNCQLVKSMLRADDCAMIEYVCKQLVDYLPEHTRPIVLVLNSIAGEQLQLASAPQDNGNFNAVLHSFLEFFVSARAVAAPGILQRCIDQLYSLNAYESGRHKWMALQAILQTISIVGRRQHDFDLRLLIWKKTSTSLLGYLTHNALDCRVKENATALHKWLMWPLTTSAAMSKATQLEACFDTEFSGNWIKLLDVGQNSADRHAFLLELKQTLTSWLTKHGEESCFPELCDAFVEAVSKCASDKDFLLQSKTLEFFNKLLTQSLSKKQLEACLPTMLNYIVALPSVDFEALINCVKLIVSSIMSCTKKHRIASRHLDEWKQKLLEKAQTHSNKSLKTQLKETLKCNDEFVVIPSVWSLKPDRLTERQKERLAEKADNIPALYNDMSQSQDSSIKPWTPSKIVVRPTRQSEPKEMPPPPTHEINPSPIVLDSLTLTPNVEEETHLNTELEKDADVVVVEDVEPDLMQEKSPEKTANSKALNDTLNSVTNASSNAVNEITTPSMNTTTPHQYTETPKSSAKQLQFADEEIANDVRQTSTLKDKATKDATDNQSENNESLLHKIGQQRKLRETNQIKESLALLQMKETSPKKPTSKFTSLSSPPDRKNTNNSTSPTLRPKTTPHLTGRSAQMINMIRNKKFEREGTASPYANVSAVTRMDKLESFMNTPETIVINEMENTSTPLPPKELLVFSRPLPSPKASPSMSILKRKLRRDSIEDFTGESPAMKRKRVSFHDPPVSVTKEYVKDTDETKSRLKRCLLLDKVAGTPEGKHVLKRQNKLESIAQLRNFNNSINENDSTTATAPSTPSIISTTPLQITNTPTTTTTTTTTNCTTEDVSMTELSPEEETSLNPNPASICDLESLNPDAVLKFVTERFTLDDIINKYFATKEMSQQKLANNLAKYISNYMSTNPKVKKEVLETLSEHHSKDFLDHAIQENLSSVVCDRLNLNSVIDYICAKSKINATCRANLLLQLPEIMKFNKMSTERLDCIKNLLTVSNLTDDNILDLITTLMQLRSGGESKHVSESAVDSSSNL